MSNKEIRVGVIGVGFMGQDHLRRIAKVTDGAVVSAIYDINQEKVAELAAEYGAKAMPTEDDLINSDEVDAVICAAWDGAHAAIVNKCIAADKPIFCEKPLATTKADCEEIVENEKASGKKLVQVGFMRRYDKDYRKIKDILDSGKLGAPLMAHCYSRTPSHPENFLNSQHVTQILIHEIDQFRWLFGEEIVKGQMLAAKHTQFAPDTIEDPYLCLMWTESGVLIDVESSANSYYGYEIGMEIVCEKGTITLPIPAEPIVKSRLECTTEVMDDWLMRFPEAYDNEMQSWVDHLLGKDVPEGPGSFDGLAANAIADALVESQNSGLPVEVTFR